MTKLEGNLDIIHLEMILRTLGLKLPKGMRKSRAEIRALRGLGNECRGNSKG